MDQQHVAGQVMALPEDAAGPNPFMRRPQIRITANYSSSDGLIPESMDIEIDTLRRDRELQRDLIAAAVDALAAVPANRYRSIGSGGR